MREGWLERSPSHLGGGRWGGGCSGNPSPHGNKEQNLDLLRFVSSHHTKEGRGREWEWEREREHSSRTVTGTGTA